MFTFLFLRRNFSLPVLLFVACASCFSCSSSRLLVDQLPANPQEQHYLCDWPGKAEVWLRAPMGLRRYPATDILLSRDSLLWRSPDGDRSYSAAVAQVCEVIVFNRGRGGREGLFIGAALGGVLGSLMGATGALHSDGNEAIYPPLTTGILAGGLAGFLVGRISGSPDRFRHSAPAEQLFAAGPQVVRQQGHTPALKKRLVLLSAVSLFESQQTNTTGHENELPGNRSLCSHSGSDHCRKCGHHSAKALAD